MREVLLFMERYGKKIYDCARLRRDLPTVAVAVIRILKSMNTRRMPAAFVSKMMLAVSAVNGCRYCIWFHGSLLLSKNVTAEEVLGILHPLPGQHASTEEAVALLFAYHYADTERAPAPEMAEQLREHFGSDIACDIIGHLDMIYFANLIGNTFDAFLDRLRGKRRASGGFLFELMVAVLSAPIVLTARLLMLRKNPLAGCAARPEGRFDQ